MGRFGSECDLGMNDHQSRGYSIDYTYPYVPLFPCSLDIKPDGLKHYPEGLVKLDQIEAAYRLSTDGCE